MRAKRWIKSGWLGRSVRHPPDTLPWVIAVGLLLLIALIAAPWGNYPLNDDWQYARAARLLAERGRIVIDTAIAPSLVGQIVLVWPFIKLFGSSYLLLRSVTLAMAVLVLWALDQILRYARVSRGTRIKALVLVVLQPWFVDLTFSFMTECYGYAFALAGVAVWLRSRKACDAAHLSPVITLGGSILTGLLLGVSFWIRQFCVVAYPALFAATLYQVITTRTWWRLWSSLGRIATGAAICIGMVAAYFAWAKAKHLLKPNFLAPLGRLSQFVLVDHQIVIGLQMVYLGAALLPMLATWPWQRRKSARVLLACAVALGFGLGTHSLIQLVAVDDAGSLNFHRVFPYSSNVINTCGIGPNTLTDVFFSNVDYFTVLPRRFWLLVGQVLLAATALWGLPVAALSRIRHIARTGREAFVFALVFASLSLLAVTLSSGGGFDRYYLPALFGITVCVAVLLHGEEQFLPRKPRPLATVGFVVLALPLAFFSVAGIHDYFRWNDTRWHLVDHARQLGIPSTSIDGGYEVNGELSFDLMRRHPEAIDQSHCIGYCHCELPSLSSIWTCFDDSYRVGVSLRDGYTEVARELPHFWLGKARPLILSRRPRSL
jgi:hypothetical protein